VDKELAKIRARFGEDKPLSSGCRCCAARAGARGARGRAARRAAGRAPSRPAPRAAGYDRKKYVWKLLYIYMLGYDVEFGHKQACDLIPATKWV
jgi:hypothetical protein